ncbi:MAG: dNTP triphosphohydrolase [FCB group bacterium]|nr:dNTP triphosphohydrolase [FCB group bacterium]MBL7028065.1 dNTP triphosphohydrolase [Candidatus Neomarinimicrobiota bacterium]MBL7122803.1 dNTP triphosphohydrolase [Candidatus Neomarinimicrobiota bacterium]
MILKNTFYTDWDCESMGERHLPENEYRNAFEIDRDRIIHSTAFRRLQGKTQVYVTGQSDQYRTRLTHSIEVAQIGRSIVNYLNRSSDLLTADYEIDSALVEAACLAHDLGNPPIGHKGESRLNELMDNWGGFEGNAQSLRILTDIVRGDRRSYTNAGMQATRACLDGILKYKIVGKEHTQNGAKFLYPDQQDILSWVHNDQHLDEIAQNGTQIRPIECAIMDLSDDIAYTTSDLFDGVKQSLLTPEQVEHFWNDQYPDASKKIRADVDQVLRNQFPMSRFIAGLIGRWIYSISIESVKDPFIAIPRYKYVLDMAEESHSELMALRALNYNLIYNSDYVKIPESKGVEILEELFLYYRDVVFEKRGVLEPLPLPAGISGDFDENQKMRMICDFVAGMTDNHAIRLHSYLKA